MAGKYIISPSLSVTRNGFTSLEYGVGLICCARNTLLIDSSSSCGRHDDKVLLASHLNVQVFVVVFVKRGGGETVAEPEVYSLGRFLEGDASKGYVGRDIFEERGVLIAEVIVFWQAFNIAVPPEEDR
jgi:hypothetical protein